MGRLAKWKRWQGVPRAVWQLRDGLLSLGFASDIENYDEEHFGNVLIEMHRGDLRIRIVKDRSEWSTQAQAGSEWYDTVAWEGVTEGSLTSAAPSLEERAKFLLERANEVETASQRPGVVDDLRRWMERWREQWRAQSSA